jgi:hypothetical protein
MRTALLSTMILLGTALGASAQTSAAAAGDPLLQKIMNRQITESNSGVTGVVRIGSGQVIPLDMAPLTPAEPLKDAVADPKALNGLKAAPGLVKKAAKRVRAKPRRATEQLEKLNVEKRKADWSGSEK